MASSSKTTFQTYDPKRIFDTAESFYRASNILFSTFHKQNIQVVPPSLTCMAFSLELFLKSLITIEKGGFPRGGHNLRDFLDLLDQSTLDKIKAYTLEIAVPKFKQYQDFAKTQGVPPPPDFDFDTAMKASENGFVNFRYVYEENFKEGEGWQGSEIVGAVRRIILERHPEWSPV